MISKCYHKEVACTVVIFCRVAALAGKAGVAEAALTTAVAEGRSLELYIARSLLPLD